VAARFHPQDAASRDPGGMMIPTLVVVARSVGDEAIQGTSNTHALWIASLRSQ
jgi:hypothetical protein